MAKTISQKVVYKNTDVKTLYAMYMNEKLHSQLTGGKAKIPTKENAAYSVYDNYISGKNLKLVKDALIVQSWRASDWDKKEMDSILILKFETKGKNAVVKMTHTNIPGKHVDSIKKGWDQYYWEPWKNYLSLQGQKENTKSI